MKRRDFLQYAMAGALTPLAQLALLRQASGQTADSSQIRLVNLMLSGGPDFRHLLPPAFDSNPASYGYAFWQARFRSFGVGATPGNWASAYASRFVNVPTTHPHNDSGSAFGILTSCGWLIDQFNAGNVAIVNNVIASDNRDHHHSQLLYEAGNTTLGKNDADRDGWGGRIAKHVSGNVVSVTSQVKQFCYGPHPSNPLRHSSERIVPASDTRNFGLFQSRQLQEDVKSTHPTAVMDRAVNAYFTLKKAQLDAGTLSSTSPFARFVDQDASIKSFASQMKTRLASFPIPTAIANLYGSSGLDSTYFGRQIRNLHDAYVAWDILNFRVASLEYGNWDSHRRQASEIEPQLSDLFARNGGLATLESTIKATMPQAWENTVIVIGGEFGRQLAANGDAGTDHGTGMTVLVIGPRVRGGVYGTMFPTSELDTSSSTRNSFSRPNSHILGRTSIHHLFGRIADHVSGSNTGDTLFAGRSSSIIESAGLLTSLLA